MMGQPGRWADAQSKTVLVLKNFNNYLADLRLLEKLKEFGLKEKPPLPSTAFLFARRKMKNRVYRSSTYKVLETVSFHGDAKVGYAIYVAGIRIGRALLVDGDLLLKEEAEPGIERDVVSKVFADIRNIYSKGKNYIVTDRISRITNKFFKKVGYLPLRPDRGDIYILPDEEKLWRFIKLVEESNLNKGLQTFYVMRLDEKAGTIEGVRETIRQIIRRLKKRLNQIPIDNKIMHSIAAVYSSCKELQRGINKVGIYLFDENEFRELQEELSEIKAQIRTLKKTYCKRANLCDFLVTQTAHR